jgi:hypothetical protein
MPMKCTLLVVLAVLVVTLPASRQAAGQLDDAAGVSPRPIGRTGNPPADLQTVARMYRTTVDCYRGLAAGYLFQTHLGIGMVAELAANKVYTPEQARTMIERMTGGMAAMQKLLEGLAGMKLPNADRDLLTTIVKLSGQVDAEGKALVKYLQSNRQADAGAYHKVRAEAEVAINRFLGIG